MTRYPYSDMTPSAFSEGRSGDLDALERELERLPGLFESMARKVIDRNPTWADLPHLLNDDELRIFTVLVLSEGRGGRWAGAG